MNFLKEKDKKMHLIAGAIISVLTVIVLSQFISFLIAPVLGLLMALIAGIGKELFDRFVQNEVFDWFDVYATVIGGCITLPIIIFGFI